MGITCRIVRDSNGNIDYIESNDGQKSILFDSLRSLYGTEKALEYYALTESENFKDVQEVKKEDTFQVLSEVDNVKVFSLNGVTSFYHASDSRRQGRLKESNAPQFGTSIYFSTNKNLIEEAFGGKNTTEVKLSIQKPVYTNTTEWLQVEQNAIEMADKDYGLKNELTLDEEQGYFKYDKDDFSEISEIPSKFISESAKKLGYDAIIDRNSPEYENEIAVLDETKIIYQEDVNTSKKETVKVEKNEVNGKLVYEPFFKGKKMGALRLLPYNGGYRVDSVVVYDKFQKKGVARNLYKYAINDLSKQGISLSSLNIRAPYAEKIWEGLVNEGIATKDGNDYRAFREPKVSEVLEYANETEEPLTKEQSVQAIDTLASFGINNSLELFEKLKEAFVKDGAIVFDRKKLEKAGYNSYEITSILTNRDLQQQIKENIYKVKNTDLSIGLEGLEVLKTDEVNIFGKQTVYVKSEREAVNEIVDGEIKNKKTETLQTLNKTYPKTLPEIDTRPFETILKVTENVAKNNPEKLKKVAQAMQEEALKYGVDLRGIENKIYPIQRLKSFTESLVNYISEPNNNFSEVYDKFFEVSQLPKVENEGNDIKLDTELSEYELFRDHNLVRKEGNTYTKVSPENIEDLYNYFLRQQESKVQELSKIDELYSKASKINDFETFVDSVSDFRDAHSAPSKDTTPTEEKINTGGDFSLEEVAKGFHNQPDDYFEPKNGARYYGYNNPEGMQSFTAISNVIRGIKAGNGNIKITSYRAVPNGVDINELKDYDWVSFSEDYTKNHGESRFGEGEYKIIQQEVDIKDLWWDGNDINEWGYDTGNTKKYSIRELKSIFDNSRKLTKEDIQARTPELEVEDYQTDSDILEALFIWKNFLGYPIKTKSNRKAPFKGMTNNPFKAVTADGIVLKNNDTLTRAKADLYEEEVVKQAVDYQDEVREKISLGEIIPEKIKTDYTIIEDGVLMTKNNTNQFLRTPLANYELIYQDGNLSFYKDVLGAEKNLSDIDFTKYLNESVKPDSYIVAKNSYSKQELEEINNKYFSCK